MIDIKFSSFFDRAAVTDKLDKATRTVLARFGALVRTTMKRSIRRRKGPAKAGSPPHSHVGLLRDLIFFGYDDSSKSVVIGPKLFKKRGSQTIPEKLEYGSSSNAAFPFANPAMEVSRPKLPGMFANSVK